jgi:S-adenosylmethionine:tRNA ribosyltransferase-isomerase
MHSERIYLSEATSYLINQTLDSNSKIISVGTTSLRCLEAIYHQFGEVRPFEGETDIFIYPGFKFNVVDSLITNFHLPKTTLLLLVSAFAGEDTIKTAYKHAINEEYMFFSYGDAMLLNRKEDI